MINLMKGFLVAFKLQSKINQTGEENSICKKNYGCDKPKLKYPIDDISGK